MRKAALIALACSMLHLGLAHAQPAPEAPPSSTPEPKTKAEADAIGRDHYDKGRKLLGEGDYDGALAEFLEARRVWPDRWAPASAAAVCLQKLERFDEALDLMTALLRDHGQQMPAATKTAVQKEIVDLKARVGTIEISKAEPGASLTIDGRARGEFPPLAPLRVAAGSHLVRVYKEGFLPVETRVEVAGGQSAMVSTPMTKLLRSGLLRVEEKEGRAFDVVVDGLVVGRTPWEGRVAVGRHSVMLRGREQLGTLPQMVDVAASGKAALALTAEDLGASMIVNPTPVEASIAVDGIFVSRGAWQGRISPGKHTLNVVADGYFAEERKVILERGQKLAVDVSLWRDPDAVRWRQLFRYSIEYGGGFATTNAFGGEVEESCTGGCTSSNPAGGGFVIHGNYHWMSGFAVGMSAGYLDLQRTLAGRSHVELYPVGLNTDWGTNVNDTLRLRGFRVGLSASYRTARGRLSTQIRIGAGALLGWMTDARSGDFKDNGRRNFYTGPIIEAPFTPWFYAAPELRAGVRVVDRLELALAFEFLLLATANPPKWNERTQVYAAGDGNATFPAQTLAAPFLMVVLPGLSVRHEF